MKDKLLDYFCYNRYDLINNLVVRNLKRKYRRSYLGFFWSLLVPLLTSFTYMVLFSVIMRFEVPNYLPLIVMNILTWSMFAISTQEGLESIFANYGILSKVPVPIHSFNFATVVTNLINFVCSLPVIFLFLWADGLYPSWLYLWLPVLIIHYSLVTYFVSVALSILYVQFRDLKHLFGIVLQLWMYATPILYPESMLPANMRFLLYLNPLAPMFISLQKILIEGTAPSLNVLAAMVSWTVVFFLASYFIYYKYKNTVLEHV